MSASRVALLAVALQLLASAGCSDGGGTCRTEGEMVPAGTFAARSGGWLAGSEARVLQIDHARGRAIVEFEKGGVRYRATYALAALRDGQGGRYGSAVELGTWKPRGDCASAEQQGPVIDAVLLKRGGKLIARAAHVIERDAGACPALSEQQRQRVVGDPDGVGVALGLRTLHIRFEAFVRPRSGDEIVVHASGGGYVVSTVGINYVEPRFGPSSPSKIGAGRGTLGWLVP